MFRDVCVCSSGAAEERGGKDVRYENPEETPHRGHEAAGTHPLRETHHDRGPLGLHRQVIIIIMTALLQNSLVIISTVFFSV